ncbi:fungal peroxidase [Mycena amicta]|nr:fungal peroxidase [Mycena amicta]
MKSTSFSVALFGLGLCATQFVSASVIDDGHSLHRRDASILIDPDAQPSLPSIGAATAAASTLGLNLTNIQGDILIGMKKNKELFFFFGITNAAKFKSALKSVILPRITSTTQLVDVSKQPQTALNIAFSQTGLNALNITDDLGDTAFTQGQFANAANLNDPGTANWVPQFAGTSIHGVLLFASDTLAKCESDLTAIQLALAKCACVKELYRLEGAARPGSQQGHEHFGFLDGISNPAVQGFQTPLPGQAVVPPGEILVGETGDTVTTRPTWAKDGSFLAFRQLKQLVPEFNKFLTDNPIRTANLTRQQGSDLLGARMVGRWKSGAPVFLSPTVDNPKLGADPSKNNDFTYAAPGETVADPTDQTKCPFSAHIRKTRPRADLGLPESSSSNHHIVRGGIPYGPEVSASEAKSNKTKTERGLAFVGYQSNILTGFQFLQRFWANNPNFVHGGVGFDPIIGANKGAPRIVNGLDPTNSTRGITIMTDFIVSRGGEYFFSPSISALATKFST